LINITAKNCLADAEPRHTTELRLRATSSNATCKQWNKTVCSAKDANICKLY